MNSTPRDMVMAWGLMLWVVGVVLTDKYLPMLPWYMTIWLAPVWDTAWRRGVGWATVRGAAWVQTRWP